MRKRRAGVIRDPLIVVMVGGTKSGPIVEVDVWSYGHLHKVAMATFKSGGLRPRRRLL